VNSPAIAACRSAQSPECAPRRPSNTAAPISRRSICALSRSAISRDESCATLRGTTFQSIPPCSSRNGGSPSRPVAARDREGVRLLLVHEIELNGWL
jgi:hypothetical protein